MVKRTYSRYGKGQRSTPYDPNWADDIDNSKRTRLSGSDELRIPQGRMEMKPSVSKKGLKFGGPTSLPDDQMDIDDAPVFSKKKTTVFDRVLNSGRYQPARPAQFKTESSGNDLKKSSPAQQTPYSSRNYQLPTPPAELQKARHTQQETREVEHLADSAQSNDMFQPKQPYVPKIYKAEKIPAPRRNIIGHRLPKLLQESALWHANQSDSPLLQLPAEVRNTIFKYVLGGNTINIDYETYRNTSDYKQPTTSVPIFKYHCTVYDRPANPFKIKPSSNEIITRGYFLLNNICRQLYVETATLPYSLNMIAFSSSSVMFNFLYHEQRLSRQQRDAITRLVLPDGILQQNMLSDLGGLLEFFLGRKVDDDAKGWYTVVRREGCRPKLVPSSSLSQ
ncbi:hypothetical protein NX059_005422 [Plenodomus lindquistii]|nr:hypothetical protein NX059_005422 [Plenodomus lindquistii]